MKSRIGRLPFFIALAFSSPAWAQETTLGAVVVTDAPELAVPAGTGVGARVRQSLAPATSDTATLLRHVPGISLQGAGGISSLPVVRGLADDRVRIKVDGMDLIASCPNHMNPALSYIDPTNVGSLAVYAGITPVSVGGDSIAGTIVVESPEPVFAGAGEGMMTGGEIGAFYRSNGNAVGGNFAARLATASFSLGYAGSTARRGNYIAGGDFRTTTASGRIGNAIARDEVGSTAYESRNHELSMAFRGGDHLLEARVAVQDVPYEHWPNQRMDMLDNDQTRLNLRYLGSFGRGTLEARAYHEKVEHSMDFGGDKRFWYGAASGGMAVLDGVPCSPVGPNCAAGMPMRTRSENSGLVLKGDVGLSARDRLRVGGELQRYRLDDWWPASGGGMGPDTFWNVRDGERDRTAAFAEWEAVHSPQWTTLAGVRYEHVRTDAGPVQAYDGSVQPAVSRVAAVNGARRARSDDNLDVTLLARHTLDERRSIEFGLARKVRSPSLYERYAWYSRGMEMLMVNWFGDGNGYIGDAKLAPEKAHTVSATFDWHAPDRRWEFRLTPYYTRVADYIDALRCPTRLGGSCTAANLAARQGFVYLQFANQSARLYGVDVSGHAPLAQTGWGDFGLGAVLNYTNGKNLETGDRLYNIMPLNTTVTLTHGLGGWDSAVEWVAVRGKKAVSEVRNELETPGYGLVNLRTGYTWRNVRLDLGVENLFDRLYYLPLGGAYVGQGTTMSAMPMGSVPRWGTAVPGMGRSFHAGVKIAF
ncbi:TonB-dependent receptor [Thauera sinica]|uniref:TonB-dependent receptor n=1 Tax=Thauera sinica TaxID=2665146 RepID=A0ABW1AQA7_9RHOO|nr:TonB-dependent receptor [Thauera sp. K11]ATE59546.1 TonB-dependent receptor [Thauera sp. K11]